MDARLRGRLLPPPRTRKCDVEGCEDWAVWKVGAERLCDTHYEMRED